MSFIPRICMYRTAGWWGGCVVGWRKVPCRRMAAIVDDWGYSQYFHNNNNTFPHVLPVLLLHPAAPASPHATFRYESIFVFVSLGNIDIPWSCLKVVRPDFTHGYIPWNVITNRRRNSSLLFLSIPPYSFRYAPISKDFLYSIIVQ